MGKKAVGVFFGGKSSEHDISIITGVQVLNALDDLRYDVVPIYINRNGEWVSGKGLNNIKAYPELKGIKLQRVHIKPECGFLLNKRGKKLKHIDVAINCCHGVNGEDGTLAGLLELANIPYTFGGVLASSVGMDKIAMKLIFRSVGLRLVPWTYVTHAEFERELYNVVKKIKGKLRYPFIIKPANLGSSIGISIANNADELIEGIRVALKYDDRVVIENALTNYFELNCACLGMEGDIKPSQIEKPVNWKKFLDFGEKYLNGDAKGMSGLKRELPAKIDEKLQKKIQKCAVKAFRTLNCKGVARIDFLYDKDADKLYVNEINTVPGSLAYYLFEGQSISFDSLLEKLISIAYIDWANKNSLEYAYKSDVLSQKGGVKLAK